MNPARRLAAVPRPAGLADRRDDDPRRKAAAQLRAVPDCGASDGADPGSKALRRVVLIVDDDDDLRSALALALELDRWTVIEARDGEEALAMARDVAPTVMVLDCRMPKKSGQQVYRELRSAELSFPVLLVTAGTDVEQIAAELGIAHFLGKPFGIDELNAALERAIVPPPGRS
jgi:two-component system, response regulator, stage 0 sporulation protein F